MELLVGERRPAKSQRQRILLSQASYACSIFLHPSTLDFHMMRSLSFAFAALVWYFDVGFAAGNTHGWSVPVIFQVPTWRLVTHLADRLIQQFTVFTGPPSLTALLRSFRNWNAGAITPGSCLKSNRAGSWKEEGSYSNSTFNKAPYMMG